MKPTKTVNVSQIEKAWKITHVSHSVHKFLTKKKIQPVHVMKFGKGNMYVYDSSVLALKEEYLKFIDKSRAPAEITSHNSDMDAAVFADLLKLMMHMHKSIEELSVKVDNLRMWSVHTPPDIPETHAYDDDRPTP